jgi:hypothetical protein
MTNMNNTTFSAIMVGSFVTLVLIIGVNRTYAENQVRNISPDQGIDVHCEGNTSNDSVGRFYARIGILLREFPYGSHPRGW